MAAFNPHLIYQRVLAGRLCPILLLLTILALALALRLYGINWDSGYAFHPDERDIYMRSGCMYDLLTEAPGYRGCGYVRDQPEASPGLPSLETVLDPDRSPLNPHWFPLGSVLVYLLVFFRSVIELFTDVGALDMRFVGRTLSSLADVGSVFIVYLLGRRMYGQGVGLLAAALTALAVIHIQNSHFYRPETFSVVFTLASFWAMLRMLERRRLRDSALLGLMVGLALAPKVNVLPLVLPLALAYGYLALDSVEGRWSDLKLLIVRRVSAHVALAATVAVAVFFVSSPYAFLDFGKFSDDLLAQANMARNAGMWPFTVQYIDTPRFLYHIQQTSTWGLGIPLGAVAWLAIPFTVGVALMCRRHRRADLLLLAWVVPGYLLLESFEVRFLRYMFPLVPFMVLLGSRMLLWLVDRAREIARLSRDRTRSGWEAPSVTSSWSGTLRSAAPWMTLTLIGLVVVATAFYALAFERVYANDHPAIEASRWIKGTVPPGTAIVSDNHWDEYIPDLYEYSVWQFPVYEPETPAKLETLITHLAESEYLVFYSNRPYGSVARLPHRYPFSAAYYRGLFEGRLGYKLSREFTSYPELAGVVFKDDPFDRAGLPPPEGIEEARSSRVELNLGYADDNVVGYDHPRVLLFRNQDHLSARQLRLRIADLRSATEDGPSPGLMMSEERKALQRGGGTWSEIIHRDSWTNRFPVLGWLLAVELVYLAALPLAMFVFRPLPDRGVVLARILGLLGASYVAWLVVSLGWIPHSGAAVMLGFGVVGGLSIFVLLTRWSEIRDFILQRWRFILGGEVLFLVAFLAFVAVREANPDLWHPWRGGEKPMELAYLNAVIRSSAMPPFDPWFAGGYLNYYYWGYFVLAGLVRVTGILPTIAFNLAVPLFFALTVTGAYSLVYNLAEGARRHRQDPHSDSEPESGAPLVGFRRLIPRSPVIAGLFASLFIAVVGNLDGMIQVVRGSWTKLFVDGQGFLPFDFWRSSRVVPPLENPEPSALAFWAPEKVPNLPDISWHITEFPFFTFLFADLHAHMMVIPFTLLTIALGVTILVGLWTSGWLWKAFAVVALAISLGSLWVVNSWDYPSYVLLVLALLVLAVYLRPAPAMQKLAWTAGLGAFVVGTSILVFLPYHLSYEPFNTGLDASKWKTPIDRYLWIHGMFLFLAATFLLYQGRNAIGCGMKGIVDRLRGRLRTESGSPRRGLEHYGPKMAFALVLMAAVYMAVAGYWTVVMLLVFLLLTGLVVWSSRGTYERNGLFSLAPMVLFAMALAISIGVELMRLEEDIGRMNTLFKYYLEVWVLLSLATAYMLWDLGTRGFLKWPWRLGPRIWVGIFAVLLGSSLVYTGWGTHVRLADRFGSGAETLDGQRYMENAVHWENEHQIELKWDLEAIKWLEDNVYGSPVVLEAHLHQYRWGSRVANYTGLPTVLGWPWHQIQQRMAYRGDVEARSKQVEEIYQTTDLERAEALLREFEVTYIVLGQLEQAYYSAKGLRKFPQWVEAGLIERVYENQGVSIYKVAW